VELVKPFGLFSKWLTNVYANIRHYVGRDMNPETRGVFDRWLASEREIALAEAYYGGLESPGFLNLVDDEEKRKKLEEKLSRIRQRILNRHAGEMAKAWTRANADRGKLTAEAESDVESEPVYKAIREAREARAWAEESLSEVMDDTPPAGQEALHDPDEDPMAESIELKRETLRQAIEARTKRRQSYLGRRVLEDRARKELRSGKTIREAMNYNNHAKTERHWSGVAAAAIAKGDREAALDALDKQQKYHALTTEAFRIRKERQGFVTRWTKRAAYSRLAAVEYTFREVMQDILTHWLIVRSERFRPDNSRPEGLILPAETDGMKNDDSQTMDEDIDAGFPALKRIIPEWIQKKRRPEGYLGINDLTANQMRELDETLGLLANRGRGIRGFFDYRRHAGTWADTSPAAEVFRQEAVDGEGEAFRKKAVELSNGSFTAADPIEAKRRLTVLENMTPVPVTNELVGIQDASLLRAKAKAIYDSLRPAINMNDGKRLHFVPSAFKKIRSHSADPRIMQAVPSLQELFMQAVPLYSEEPREKGANNIAWHTYAVKIGDGGYIRLTAWEISAGELELDFHDVNLSDPDKKKGAPPLSAHRVTNILVMNYIILLLKIVSEW
jgi:hypothetical protein